MTRNALVSRVFLAVCLHLSIRHCCPLLSYTPCSIISRFCRHRASSMRYGKRILALADGLPQRFNGSLPRLWSADEQDFLSLRVLKPWLNTCTLFRSDLMQIRTKAPLDRAFPRQYLRIDLHHSTRSTPSRVHSPCAWLRVRYPLIISECGLKHCVVMTALQPSIHLSCPMSKFPRLLVRLS
jgi:hypothetical protein